MKDSSRVSVKDTSTDTVVVSMPPVNGWEEVCINVLLTNTLLVVLIDTELNSGTLGEGVIVNWVDSATAVGVATVAEGEVDVL